MIVGGEQRLGSQEPAVADIFHHCPCDGEAVEGACSTPDLIQDQKAF